MLATHGCCRQTQTAAVALSFLLCAIAATRADAADTPALKILRNLKSLQAQHGSLAPELLPRLIELGQLYSAGQCDRALDILDLALEVSRRHEGLFNTTQLDIYEPLIHCYLTLDRPADLYRAEQYVLLIHQSQYGQNDPRLLPVLETVARTYEEAGLYLSARKLHRRALDLAGRTAGEDGLSLVTPLRGIARAFRLEYTYGLALPDVLNLRNVTVDLHSRATFSATADFRLDRLGQRSLERAVDILRSHLDAHADADPALRAAYLDTLLELGDWHQLARHKRDARQTYRELWGELTDPASDLSDTGIENPLSAPESLPVRSDNHAYLRRPPIDLDDQEKYIIDFDFTVTREGGVKDITVIESNAPKATQEKAAYDLKRMRFRPRFLDGEPVDTTGVYHRQTIYDPRR